jgi:hypothetical protein
MVCVTYCDETTAARACSAPDEPASIAPHFGLLLASLLGAIAAIILANGWPVPIHQVRYSMAADPAPGLRPVRYRFVSVAPDDTIRFEGREVSLTGLHAAANRANGLDPSTGYFLGVHPEARWETVLETMAVLRRTVAADIRLPHARPYDPDPEQ